MINTNIQDTTDPKDWEDFWNGDEESILQELMQPNFNLKYVKNVLDGEKIAVKRESPLSE
jgi:hypothetical protein